MEKQEKQEEKLTESQLNALYMYLDMNADSMTAEELEMWKVILEKVDPEFYDN